MENMNNNGNKSETVSREEARELLKELAIIKRGAVDSVSPPWWLNLLLSTSYGMIFVSYASMRHENVWALGLIASVSLLFLIARFIYYSYRLMGIKIRLMPETRSGQWLNIGHGALAAVGIVAGRELHVNGYEWITYMMAFSLACFNAYLIHVYPTGDIVERK